MGNMLNVFLNKTFVKFVGNIGFASTKPNLPNLEIRLHGIFDLKSIVIRSGQCCRTKFTREGALLTSVEP